MTGVEPSVSTDPPPRPQYFFPCSEAYFLELYPFPRKFDHVKIEKWFRHAKVRNVCFMNIGAIIRDAGHINPIRLQHIHAVVVAVGLPPPPPFNSATSS